MKNKKQKKFIIPYLAFMLLIISSLLVPVLGAELLNEDSENEEIELVEEQNLTDNQKSMDIKTTKKEESKSALTSENLTIKDLNLIASDEEEDEITATLYIQKDGFLVFNGIGTPSNGDCRQMYLEGVEFTLYDSDNNIIEKKVTVAGERLAFTGLEKSTTYYLEETKGLDEYRASSIRYTIEVTDEKGEDIISGEESWIIKIPEYPNYGATSGPVKTPLIVVNSSDPVVYKKINVTEDSLTVDKSDTFTFNSTIWLPGDVKYWDTFQYNKLEIIDLVDERLELVDTPTLSWSYGALSASDYDITTTVQEDGKTLVKAEITNFNNLKRTTGIRWDSYNTNLQLQFKVKVAEDTNFTERIFSSTKVDFINSGETEGTVTSNEVYVKPEVESKSITVEKIWKDAPDVKPTISLQLLQNDIEFNDPVMLEDGVVTYTWEALDVYNEDDELYIYTVKEIDVPENYKVSYSEDGLTITNTHIPEITDTISITVEKVWINAPEIKPTITIQLLQNGNIYGNSISLKNSELKYTWDDLLEYDENNELYIYTVQEIDVPKNYDVSYSEDGLTITNTYVPLEPGKTTVLVNKLWVDAPKEKPMITLQLMRDGEPIQDIINLQDGMVNYKWENLDQFDENGKEYFYTVKEVNIPEYYDADYSEDGLIITNTYTKSDITEPPTQKIKSNDNQVDSVETGDYTKSIIYLVVYAVFSGIVIMKKLYKKNYDI